MLLPLHASARPDAERILADDVASFTHDPLGFVKYIFPWGEPNSSLYGYEGPRDWQADFLERLGSRLRTSSEPALELAPSSHSGDRSVSQLGPAIRGVVQEARASGHGIGKSALVSWLVLWAMSTYEDTRGVVTANTETQLRTKTWPELSKWYRLALNRSWFTLTATAIFSNVPGHDRNWRMDIIPWSIHNTEAFAGLHNQGKRILLIFDEASAIDDKIWEVSEGALTDEDTEIMWLVFGNPTRNTGRFRECFGRLRHRWGIGQIDSRDVPGTNKAQLDKWVQDYGEDSDFVRVRVRGVFPRASAMQFIGSDVVQAAMQREERMLIDDPLVLGIDLARGGDDRNVMYFRRGFCARGCGDIPRPIMIPGEDTRDSMRLVSKVVDVLNLHKPDAIFMDGTGVGGPICDRIRQLGYPVIEVQFGGKSPDPRCANMRAYMWSRMREWLLDGGAIQNDADLEQDLTGPEYSHDRNDRLVLESKEHMKEQRGLASPDLGDALALTFAAPVGPRSALMRADQLETEYDPFAKPA